VGGCKREKVLSELSSVHAATTDESSLVQSLCIATIALSFFRPCKAVGRLVKPQLLIFSTKSSSVRCHRQGEGVAPLSSLSPPTASQPFSTLHPAKLNQVAPEPSSHETSVHPLPARSTRRTFANKSLLGGMENGASLYMRATEVRIAFGLY